MSQYQTGTVTVTNGSATVTGSGTAWLNTIEPGHIFVRATMVSGQRIDDLVYYTVASVQSNTQLTLTAPYGGTSGSGQPYGITRELSPGGIPLLAQRSIGSVPIFNGAVVDLDARTAAAEQAVSELGTAAFRDAIGSGDVYARGGTVGTVSQSGGVPTGAVIERDSNDDGEYVRFADGTQICTSFVEFDRGTISVQDFDMPANFTNSDVSSSHSLRVATSISSDNFASSSDLQGGARNNAWRYRISPEGSPGDLPIMLFAKGRWF